MKYVLVLVCAIVTLLLFTWGYSTNLNYGGLEHLPIYIGWFMLFLTVLAALNATFRR